MHRGFLFLCLGAVLLPPAAPYALAAPLKPGNVLVADPFWIPDHIQERTISGSLVQTIEVPYHGGVRAIAVDSLRYLHVWNGPFDAWWSRYDPFPGTWEHHGHPGWSASNCFPCNGIDVLEPYVFVTDMGADGRGLIRFDTSDGSGQRFGMTNDYSDLTVGQNGLLYARRADPVDPPPPTVIDAYDPIALAPLASVTLSERTLTIAVDGEGSLFGCRGGSVNQYDGSGAVMATFPITFPEGEEGPLYDIDLTTDGRFVMSTGNGYVILTDREFNRLGSFRASLGGAYVAIIEGNRGPTANGGGPYSGTVGFPLTLNGSGSSDPNGDGLSFHWDLGDGSIASVMNPVHTFAAVDSYLVVLTVSDGASESRDSTYVRTSPPAFAARVSPNPLGPSSRLVVQMSRPGTVTMKLFDASGRRVRTFAREGVGIGVHAIPIDRENDAGRALASGLYYYVVEAGGERVRGRVTILR